MGIFFVVVGLGNAEITENQPSLLLKANHARRPFPRRPGYRCPGFDHHPARQPCRRDVCWARQGPCPTPHQGEPQLPSHMETKLEYWRPLQLAYLQSPLSPKPHIGPRYGPHRHNAGDIAANASGSGCAGRVRTMSGHGQVWREGFRSGCRHNGAPG